MRTTLDIHDDVLAAAKELSRQRRRSLGNVVSELLRQALTGTPADVAPPAAAGRPSVGGFRPFPSRGRVVGNEVVDALRDAEGV